MTAQVQVKPGQQNPDEQPPCPFYSCRIFEGRTLWRESSNFCAILCRPCPYDVFGEIPSWEICRNVNKPESETRMKILAKNLRVFGRGCWPTNLQGFNGVPFNKWVNHIMPGRKFP